MTRPRLPKIAGMHSIVETTRNKMSASCRKRGVSRLEIFGSAAQADFDTERSHLDFLVVFDPNLEQSLLGTWSGLKKDLESLLARQVDLVSFGSVINPYVRASIQRDRQFAYGT